MNAMKQKVPSRPILNPKRSQAILAPFLTMP